MDKQWFNDEMNKIEVPRQDVSTVIKHGIMIAQKEKPTKSPIKRIRIPLIAASLIIGVFSSGFVSPQMKQVLAKVPIIGNIYPSFYDKVGEKLTKNNLVTTLNQKATSNNIGVTVNNVYYDGGRISVTFKVENLEVDSDGFTLITNLQMVVRNGVWPLQVI